MLQSRFYDIKCALLKIKSVVIMSSSSAEQILIVESNNLSFKDNTLAHFRTRLQREINLNGPHEIALLDATIPQQVYNVHESNYFVISRYGLIKKGMTKRDYVTSTPNGTKCYLEYSVQCKIPPGYYSTVDDLMATVAENIYDTIGQKALKIGKTIIQKLIGRDEKKYWSGVGQYTPNKFLVSVNEQQSVDSFDKYWYSKNTTNIEDDIISIKGLKRIKFHKESQRVAITPDQVHNPEYWRTEISISDDIAQILGYNKNKILLSHIPGALSYAPFISKISPEETIYVYSSVINNVRVSNHEVQLLRAIPFSYNDSAFGSNNFIEFNNAHFIELNTSRLLYLDFELRGTSGSRVQFENGSKHVRLTLKIRPCKTA